MPTSDDNDYRQRLDNFYAVLKPKLQNYREMKRHLDRFLSTDFNVFNRIEPKENALSGIIADLLNPTGSHGQQRMFLDAFLRQINRCDLLNKHVDIRCEYPFINQNDRGRIDILVDFGDFGIGIENKPWAGDLDEQLRKYHDYLKERYNNQFCLIYLTRDKRRPPENSIRANLVEELINETGQLRLVSYSNKILEWLRECVQLCESDKFRWFLRDFMDYIPTMMEGRQMTGERNVIVEHALENKENLKTTLDICFIFDELREQIIREFLKELKECLKKHLDSPEYEYIRKWPDEGQWEDECSLLKKYEFFGFRKRSWRPRCHIGIEQQPKGDIVYGVRKERGFQEDIPDLRETIDDKTGMSGKKSDWWEWYIEWKGRYGNWKTKEALINIKYEEEEAVKEIVNKLIILLRVAGPIIDREVGRNS